MNVLAACYEFSAKVDYPLLTCILGRGGRGGRGGGWEGWIFRGGLKIDGVA